MGDYDDAEAEFTATLSGGETHRHSYRALFNRANCRRKTGRLREAVLDLRAAVELDAGAPAAHNSLALSLCAMGNYGAALQSMSRALEASPNNGVYLNNRGLILYHLGRLKDASSDLDLAIQMGNSRQPDITAHFHRGNVRLALGRIEDALSDLAVGVRACVAKSTRRNKGGRMLVGVMVCWLV